MDKSESDIVVIKKIISRWNWIW